MEETDLTNNRISTNVRKKDVELLVKDITILAMKYSLRALNFISPNLAGKRAFKIFMSPQMRSNRRALGPFKENSGEFIKVADNKIKTFHFIPDSEVSNGKKVLLVHGWEARAFDYHKFTQGFLDSGYEVVSFDGPAHGESSGSMTTAIEFAEVIKELSFEHGGFDTVVGHSFGCFASLYAFNKYPGITPANFTAISGPNKLRDVFKSYYEVLDIPAKVQESMEHICEQRFDARVDTFSNSNFIKGLKEDTKVLLVHDSDDLMVRLSRSLEIKEDHDRVEFLKTQGLGHNRILNSTYVVNSTLDFVK